MFFCSTYQTKPSNRNSNFQLEDEFPQGKFPQDTSYFNRNVVSWGCVDNLGHPLQLKIGVGATRCLLGGVTVKTHRGEALKEVAAGAIFFSALQMVGGIKGFFCRDCQGHGNPLYGKWDPYYSHTIPISLGILMGVAWE